MGAPSGCAHRCPLQWHPIAEPLLASQVFNRINVPLIDVSGSQGLEWKYGLPWAQDKPTADQTMHEPVGTAGPELI